MKRMAESSSSSSSNKNNKVVTTTTTSWSDYKDCFIGPSVQQKKKQNSSTLTGPHVNPDQRLSSDQFWYKQFEEERQRLQAMNHHDPDIARTVVSKRPSITTPFDIYEHLYLDPMIVSSSTDDNNDPSSKHSHSHQPVLSPSITQKIYNPQTRAEADEYWYQTFMEEKAKLQKYNTNLNKEREQVLHESKQQQDKKIQPKSKERKWFWDGWFSQQKEQEQDSTPSSSSSLSP